MGGSPSLPEDIASKKSIFEFNARFLEGEACPLERFRGNVCLVVNVASK
jgi:glutathione peroxidase-family protein